jgi:hypothetical protein
MAIFQKCGLELIWVGHGCSTPSKKNICPEISGISNKNFRTSEHPTYIDLHQKSSGLAENLKEIPSKIACKFTKKIQQNSFKIF